VTTNNVKQLKRMYELVHVKHTQTRTLHNSWILISSSKHMFCRDDTYFALLYPFDTVGLFLSQA